MEAIVILFLGTFYSFMSVTFSGTAMSKYWVKVQLHNLQIYAFKDQINVNKYFYNRFDHFKAWASK